MTARNRLTDLRCAWKRATLDERVAFLRQIGLPKTASTLRRALNELAPPRETPAQIRAFVAARTGSSR